ncbi:hypothetical protein RRG08_037957 [Elysia crispata]|uniref:Uncharacterized protein n=1 Tax=Elysia crispata TaxID=231223 RepID=A0AAE1ACH6_9GAST|nr:hypothetical protein RRG08_037957 [Elysia crispata]
MSGGWAENFLAMQPTKIFLFHSLLKPQLEWMWLKFQVELRTAKRRKPGPSPCNLKRHRDSKTPVNPGNLDQVFVISNVTETVRLPSTQETSTKST